MEKVQEGKREKEDVLEEAKQGIIKISKDFKKKEVEIGKDLLNAYRETRDHLTALGNCPNCKDGTLQIKKSKHGQFISCSAYPNCKTIISLPANAFLKPAEKKCEICQYPLITTIKKGKRPMNFCVNPECKSKYVEGKAGREAKAIAKGELKKQCPGCKKGKLVLRKSIYGSFYGCDQFPKCRYTERLENKKI